MVDLHEGVPDLNARNIGNPPLPARQGTYHPKIGARQRFCDFAFLARLWAHWTSRSPTEAWEEAQLRSEARSARYGCTSNVLPVAGLVTHLCTIPVRMGLDPPRETWNGGWAGSCGQSQVPGCHKQCRDRSSGWRRTEQASQRMIYVGYRQSGTGCAGEMRTAETP